MKLKHFLTPWINLYWIKDLNLRPKTIKFVEENIGRTHSDINHSKILNDLPPRVIDIKTKINKWDLTKFKCFWTMKETTSKVKRQPLEWEKRIAKEKADKIINLQNIQATHAAQYQQMNNLITKWSEDLNGHFSKEGKHMLNKHMKRCSKSLIFREKQIKTTMKYNLTPVRMVIKKCP